MSFIVDYWQYISIALVVILDLVILIFKKARVQYKLPHSWYPFICDLVKEAESIYGAGHGSEKLNYVIEKVKTTYNVNHNDLMFNNLVKTVIEDILSAPMKKGDNDG